MNRIALRMLKRFIDTAVEQADVVAYEQAHRPDRAEGVAEGLKGVAKALRVASERMGKVLDQEG